jgi:deazaflavin-dependent oxidoreductase (nitroreductase family)
VTPTDELGDQLAASGKFVRIETRGRASGRPRSVTVGFAEEANGSLLVAAGEPDADWAENLLAEPRCVASVGERRFAVLAEPLGPAEAARAVTELILKYGTPAERLGRGTAFRLRPDLEVR